MNRQFEIGDKVRLIDDDPGTGLPKGSIIEILPSYNYLDGITTKVAVDHEGDIKFHSPSGISKWIPARLVELFEEGLKPIEDDVLTETTCPLDMLSLDAMDAAPVAIDDIVTAREAIDAAEPVDPMSVTQSHAVNPSHYADWVIEPITFIMRNSMPFWMGNIIKYAARAGRKIYDGMDATQSEITDLEKVRRYCEMRINELKGEEKL